VDDKDDFARQARANQDRLAANLQPSYDFIVCGSGSSGSVVARRLAENPDVSVFLLEAGGSDQVPTIDDALLVGYYDGRDLRFGWESLLKSPGSSQAQATRSTAVMLPEAEATHAITL
jgi:choline dehydrogenase-like flavoprotein